LVSGDLSEFDLDGKCAISESFANKITDPGESAIGKEIITKSGFSGKDVKYEVVVVYKDFVNTLVPNFEIIVNASKDQVYAENIIPKFGSIGQYVTLIKVAKGSSRSDIQDKINIINKENYPNWAINEWPIYTLDEVYFLD